MISDEIYSRFLYFIFSREEPIPANLISIEPELTVPQRCGRAFRRAGVSHSLIGSFIAYIFIFERFLKDTFPSQFNVFILLVQLGMSISLHLLLAKFRSYLDL